MAGAALRGMGKVLAKHLRKAPVLGKRVKGAYPATKPRGKGAYPAIKPSEALGIKQPKGIAGTRIAEKARPIIPEIKKTKRDIGKGAIIAGVAYAAGKAKAKKEAKAKETKEKLKKATEKHKKKTKEKREKHGKPHA